MDREVCARLVSDCRSSDTGSLTVAAQKQREATLLSVAAPSDGHGSVRRSRLSNRYGAACVSQPFDTPTFAT